MHKLRLAARQADSANDFLTATQSFVVPTMLSAYFFCKNGLWRGLLPSGICFVNTVFYRTLVSERTVNFHYDQDLAKMGLTQFEERVVSVMHQMRASDLLIQKYDEDNL